jgi:isoleucyl-tRNA synthetase
LLDRWLLSELQATVTDVSEALDEFDPTRAGRRLTTFIDDLSNWYVRRSRRRFWDGDAAALATLRETLDVLTRLLAPFVPFVTEAVWQALVTEVDTTAPDSVHLASWPSSEQHLVDPALGQQMALVRRLVELGRAARAASKVKTRQPLGRALVAATGFDALPEQLRQEIADELNVATLERLSGDLVDRVVKPNFRSLGRRFGKETPAVAAAITATDATALAAALAETGTATVDVSGTTVAVTADDVVVTEVPREGWAVETAAGETVALDLEVTPELRRAGLAREAVRLIQDARKNADLDVTDRIELWWQASSEETAQAIREHLDAIAREVLAAGVQEGPPTADIRPVADPDLGVTFWLRQAGG